MDFFLYGTSHTQRTDGPELRIHCAACGDDTSATTFETEERIRLFFVPLPLQVERHVICDECGEDRLSSLPLTELADLEPEAAGRYLYMRVPLLAKALAVLSLALFCFPFVSVFIGGAAAIMTRKSRSWEFRVGLAGAILTTVLWCGLFLRSALIELGVI